MFGSKTAFKCSFILALLGAFASIYLLVHHIRLHLGWQDGPSFCSVNAQFDCDRVAMSSYSEFLGIPVAAFGLFYYLLWLLLLRANTSRIERPETWALLKVVALCGLIPVAILATVSYVEIQTICLVCAFTYFVTLGLGTVAFRAQPTGEPASLLSGVKELLSQFLPLRGARFNFGFVLSVALVAVASLFLPSVIMGAYRPADPIEHTETAEAKALRLWRAERQAPQAMQIVTGGPDHDFELGDPNGPVLITTYSDFACPHCKVVDEYLEKLATEMKVRLVFKNFPLDRSCNPLINRSFHDFSCRAAELARCAGAKDERLYWVAHDMLFAVAEMNEAALKSIEESLRKDVPDISRCIESDEQMVAINRHVSEGVALQLPGTPGVYVEGKRIEVMNAAIVRKILEEAMRRKFAPSP